MSAPSRRTYLGYEALVRRYQLRVPPLRRVFLATERTLESRVVRADGEERIELPLQRLSDPESLVGRLTFALKREHLNLTLLGALFELPEVLDGVQAWLRDKPSSKYSRMAGHLAHRLTGHEFDYTLPAGSPRVLAHAVPRLGYPSSNKRLSSCSGSCPIHVSPVPTAISASSRLLRISASMRSSKVPRVMKRCTCTLRCCPMR